MVFYRKYRPQTIEELDSEKVRDLLSSALSSKEVAHAFLFTGPKGLGKTSAARIVAKAVNCEEKSKIKNQKSKLQIKSQNLGDEKTDDQRQTTKDQIEPCNKCGQCLSITNGTNIDVIEIDGASNRGIDEVRDLREKIRLAPASSKKKVYTIDEVHMLTTEAFNALLKTLEEPPSHVIFVLCTTEPHKVPATIISRCVHIPFRKAKIEELVRSFERIAGKEKLDIDKEALEFIASLSDGSFRDGVKILEEMTTFNKKITKELIERKFQISNIKFQMSEMIGSLSKRDVKKGLQLVSSLVEQGVDFKYFTEQLISELHEMLLAQVGIEDSSKFIPIKSGQSSKLSMGEIKELVELLSRAYGELKYAVLPQLPLELAIVEWSLKDTLSLPRSGEGAEVANENFLVRDAKKGLSSNRIKSPASSHGENFVGSPRQGKDNSNDSSFWLELIDKVKAYNHSVAGVLRGCTLKSYDNNVIVIETGYKFHKERLDERKTREILEEACEEISGKKIKVDVLLK